MKEGGAANLKMAASYRDLLVNRGAYTVQSYVPDAGGKYYYYRPRDQRRLTLETIRDHLNGLITVGLYAIDPRSQCSKWLAVDADYATALNDLLKLRYAMKEDGLEPALEQSRRGAHLWVFGAEPLPARCWRLYIHNLALKIGVPVKKDKTEGIEIFPRQDELGLTNSAMRSGARWVSIVLPKSSTGFMTRPKTSRPKWTTWLASAG